LLREDGFYLTATYIIAFLIGRVRNNFISRQFGVKKIKIGPRAHLRGLSCIEMGEDFAAESSLWMEAITHYNGQRFEPRIVIGKHVRISHFVHIAATNFVDIGDHVLIGSKVIITDHNHGQYSREHTSPDIPPTQRPLDQGRRVTIGRNVWLADGVVVTPGSSIGEGSVIGANSVVLGNIPAYSIAVGIPATIRKTFDFATQEWTKIE
jgi:lipopolysaccharide O-acetyltransferase